MTAQPDHHLLINHGPGCGRPAPELRLSWTNLPEAWCPACGRHAIIPTDQEQK